MISVDYVFHFSDCISINLEAVRLNSKEPKPSEYSFSGLSSAEHTNLTFASYKVSIRE